MALEDKEIEYMSQRATYWLRCATGTKGWTDPCAYTAPAGILEGELGTYKGVRVVELTDAEMRARYPDYRVTEGWDTP